MSEPERPVAELTSLRPLNESDLPEVQRIYAFHVLNGFASFEEVPPDLAELDRRRREVAGRGLPFLVAEAAGAVVGFAYAGPYRTRSAYRYTVEDSVYVAQHATGRGHGRALLARLIERCGELGYRQMVAVIGDSANAASIGLHRALGFSPAGTLVAIGFKRGRWIDSVLMQRPLGPGSEHPPG